MVDVSFAEHPGGPSGISYLRWEAAPPQVRAVFTTRQGNLDLRNDEADEPAGDWGRVRDTFGLRDIALMVQQHGSDVVEASAAARPSADGLVSVDGSPVAVVTADCVPLLVACGEVIGAVHVGWRGFVSGIVSSLAQKLGSGVKGATAAIGPTIGQCCLVVGDDVAALFDERHVERGADGKLRVDLPEAVAEQLAVAGFQRVDVADLCTSCDERFHSHRRDGTTAGRQAGIVWR